VSLDWTVQQAPHGGHLPLPTNQIRLSTPDSAMPFLHAQQGSAGHRFIGTLDLNQLRLTENRCAINQPRRGRTEHYPTRRSDRLHPLSHRPADNYKDPHGCKNPKSKFFGTLDETQSYVTC